MVSIDARSITRSDDLRGENRRRVLDALRTYGSCSPAQLCEATGLSSASISSLTSQMADQSIVCSARTRSSNGEANRGRPKSMITLDATAGDIVALMLTIDTITVQRVNYAGEVIHSDVTTIDSRSLPEDKLLQIICKAVDSSINNESDIEANNRVRHIGVAFQGVTENDSGVLAWSPIINHTNISLGTVLQNRFQRPVTLNNDCRLIAEALSRSSSKQLGSSFAALLFSQGVGLGLTIDGKPFSGMRTSALELGHLCFERNGALCRCGKRGCIEAYAADYGIQRLATGQSIHDDPSGRVAAQSMVSLYDAAKAGDTAAIQAFAIAGAALGEGLVTLFTLFDPMPVALVGRKQHTFELMRSGLHSAFRNYPIQGKGIDELLHCFDDAEPLLAAGLVHNTLSTLDRHFANHGKATKP